VTVLTAEENLEGHERVDLKHAVPVDTSVVGTPGDETWLGTANRRKAGPFVFFAMDGS
jgi:hypothetical protein